MSVIISIIIIHIVVCFVPCGAADPRSFNEDFKKLAGTPSCSNMSKPHKTYAIIIILVLLLLFLSRRVFLVLF